MPMKLYQGNLIKKLLGGFHCMVFYVQYAYLVVCLGIFPNFPDEYSSKSIPA